jgi:hypothetical protein
MFPTSSVQTWLVEHDPIDVIAYRDPLIERLGHPVESAYVEKYWLGILGPSATWALRRLAGWLETRPDGFPLPQAPLARELGLSGNLGRHSPGVRTLARLVLFDFATITPDERLAVRLAVPPLPARHIARLPGHLALQHKDELEAALDKHCADDSGAGSVTIRAG